MSLFDDFGDLNQFFNQAWNQFTRPVKDMQPFNCYSCDKGYIIVVNTLGIDKNNLSVTLENEKGRAYPVLKIVGETNLEKINFKNKVNLGISLKIDQHIKDISYKCENGLTTILVETEKPTAAKIINAKMVDDNSLDW